VKFILCGGLGVCVSDVLPFRSEEALLQYYMSLNDTSQYTCAIIFEEFPKSIKTEGNIKYKIRISERNVQTSLIFDEFQSAGPGASGTIIIKMCNTLHI
jgi:quinol monooxygenase YgiN